MRAPDACGVARLHHAQRHLLVALGEGHRRRALLTRGVGLGVKVEAARADCAAGRRGQPGGVNLHVAGGVHRAVHHDQHRADGLLVADGLHAVVHAQRLHGHRAGEALLVLREVVGARAGGAAAAHVGPQRADGVVAVAVAAPAPVEVQVAARVVAVAHEGVAALLFRAAGIEQGVARVELGGDHREPCRVAGVAALVVGLHRGRVEEIVAQRAVHGGPCRVAGETVGPAGLAAVHHLHRDAHVAHQQRHGLLGHRGGAPADAVGAAVIGVAHRAPVVVGVLEVGLQLAEVHYAVFAGHVGEDRAAVGVAALAEGGEAIVAHQLGLRRGGAARRRASHGIAEQRGRHGALLVVGVLLVPLRGGQRPHHGVHAVVLRGQPAAQAAPFGLHLRAGLEARLGRIGNLAVVASQPALQVGRQRLRGVEQRGGAVAQDGACHVVGSHNHETASLGGEKVQVRKRPALALGGRERALVAQRGVPEILRHLEGAPGVNGPRRRAGHHQQHRCKKRQSSHLHCVMFVLHRLLPC